MFELFFKYPATVFSRGRFVLVSGWPVWVLVLLGAAGAAALAWLVFRWRPAGWTWARSAIIWALQSLLLAALLLMLWQPAISVSMLRSQQNIVAVVLDGSTSMGIEENGSTRRDQALRTLDGGLRSGLASRFLLRYYSLGETLQRLDKPESLAAAFPATRIGDNLRQVLEEAGTLPIGAVVLLSDGADNSGGIDLETISEIRRRRIPVHTIGFGREQLDRDIELIDVQTPARVLADSRLSAQVSFRQRGYAGGKARLTVREGGKTLASQEVTLKGDGVQQVENIAFQAGLAGSRNLQVSVEPLNGEENVRNNALGRLVHIDGAKPRVLYIDGEPRWEFKFIRRALEEDRSVKLTTMLRTTQNKIYRQGVEDPKELEQGFPASVEELFAYQGLIIGSVEAGYFTTSQQELIRQFADRRGGGVLFLAGRSALSDGGYPKSPLAEMLPVTLGERKGTFLREPAYPELTPAGRDSLLCRIEDNAERNAARWSKLPFLADHQDAGTPKPGAVVLADMRAGGRGQLPLLVTENYGRGRTAVLATSGTWRWQMQQDLKDQSHEMFWQQLVRWLVAGTPGRVVATTPRPVLSDESRVTLRAEVRDRNFLPAQDATVEARIMGPEGEPGVVELMPDPMAPGSYIADWPAMKAGSYVAEVYASRAGAETGWDVVMFRRENGVAEGFRTTQNRELLEKLSAETGGRYYRPEEAAKLTSEISYSEAGISTRETRDLWNMPACFLLLAALKTCEWLLRRKWGVV
jgi:uncharacterized membrane protein